MPLASPLPHNDRKSGPSRRVIGLIAAAFLAVSHLTFLVTPEAGAQVASQQQRSSLVASGAIQSAATVITRLESTGGQVLDLDLYLPTNQAVTWFYRVIYRDSSGRVREIDLGAVDGKVR